MLPHAAPDIQFDFTASDALGQNPSRPRAADRELLLASEAFDRLRWEAEEFIDAGDAVVVPVRFYARGHESGIGTSARAVQVYWFKDGRVVRYQPCESRADALEAVRLEE